MSAKMTTPQLLDAIASRRWAVGDMSVAGPTDPVALAWLRLYYARRRSEDAAAETRALARSTPSERNASLAGIAAALEKVAAAGESTSVRMSLTVTP